jgi:hypothetical protein
VKAEGFDLPDPDLLVTNCGAYVYLVHPKTGEYILDVPYLVRINQNNWNKSSLERLIGTS